jgi:predicted negative regulator of RcsB-dependent stress response
LVEALKTDTSPEVRAESAKVLANARERSGVVTALEEAARDVDQSVAQAALAALSQPLSP